VVDDEEDMGVETREEEIPEFNGIVGLMDKEVFPECVNKVSPLSSINP
jgi:hypothetical protein